MVIAARLNYEVGAASRGTEVQALITTWALQSERFVHGRLAGHRAVAANG